jgi:hypothetical protein
MNISMDKFCKVAALVFAAGALAQVTRAIVGFDMIAGSTPVPVGVSWAAAIVLAALAWLGFTAQKA